MIPLNLDGLNEVVNVAVYVRAQTPRSEFFRSTDGLVRPADGERTFALIPKKTNGVEPLDLRPSFLEFRVSR